MIERAVVIGAGISGMQTALDIANSGYEVILIEKNPSIGGHMAQLSETFPTLDCSQCIMTPRMVEVGQHTNIRLLTLSEVTAVKGEVGNFRVQILRHPRYVIEDKCTGCGECATRCPVETLSEFDEGMGTCKAIYRPFGQAIPAVFTIDKRDSPCKIACPAHIPVQGYLALIGKEKFQESLDLVRQTVPFAGTLGRICDHSCETVCKRHEEDQPLSICALKRFVYDACSGGELPEPAERIYDERVAIVGAGPAGLTAAYDLARLGYGATVYEAQPVAGGMLAVGIPEYRLPRDVLDHEIDIVRALGVEVLQETPVGRDGGPSLDDLRREYNAVFLAVGAHKSRHLEIPGEDLEGVIHSTDFLRSLNLKKEIELGRRVAVIGGGNAAIDAARCALRLGGEVTLVYRRSRAEMPAIAEEVEAAMEEGVQFQFLVTPTRVLEQDGRVAGLECTRMELGELDESGRRRPVPIPGSEFTLDMDAVIISIGQRPDLAPLVGVEATRWGTLIADEDTMATPLEGIFAGGDAVTGPASAIEAMAAGKRASESIHRYLRGQDLRTGRTFQWPRLEEIQVSIPSGIEPAPRQEMPHLLMAERCTTFKEVELGLTKEQAVAEARRCLSCAVCSECLECVRACEAQAIDHRMREEIVELDVGAIIVSTGYELYDGEAVQAYGYGSHPDILNGLEFERLLSASGPTVGQVTRPSDGKVPKEVVFIQCAGSRNPEHGMPYCSKICCMYTAKHAVLYKHRVHDGQAYVFYMDVRAGGKGYEEFVTRAMEEERTVYIRGRVSKVFPKNGKIMVWGADTLTGHKVEITADMVVVASAIVPSEGSGAFAEMLGIGVDEFGFYTATNEEMTPVESRVPGVFLAGVGLGPQDIPETVAQASGAAAKVLALFEAAKAKEKIV